MLDFYNHLHPQVNRFQYWELRVIWLMLRSDRRERKEHKEKNSDREICEMRERGTGTGFWPRMTG